MTLDVQIRNPDKGATLTSCVFVSYGSFLVDLTLTAPYPALPLTVQITESPDPAVGPAAFPLPAATVGILELSEETKIDDPTSSMFWRKYTVPKLDTFALEDTYPRVRFKIQLKTDDATLSAFKGSQMKVTVTDGGSYSESKTIPILVADPNNHYHWRGEPTFVDGAWFKVVHIDSAKQLATPFFFLYGVSNPKSLSPTGESFVMAGRGGAIALDATLRVPVPSPAPTSADAPYDPKPPRPGASAYAAETFYGLDARVSPGLTSPPPFSASDTTLKGTGALPSGDPISWDLHLTKFYKACVTDWNPLSHFQDKLPGQAQEEPYGKLSRYTGSFSGMKALYMSHNMNSFVSGSLSWAGTTYTFSDALGHKAYQDSNWGAEGFPHPYVWMQANNFYDGAGSVVYDTALVALYTPLMPVDPPWGSATKTPVAGICLRHKGVPYEVIVFDPSAAGRWPAPPYSAWRMKGVQEIAMAFDCSVDFDTPAGTAATLDMTKITDPATIAPPIGPFPRPHTIKPVKWTVHGANRAGDDIMIVAECDPNAVMFLAAPMGGVMVDDVTKETLLARFTVILKPAAGGPPITLVSDFGTAEYGD